MEPMIQIHRKTLDRALKELCQDLQVEEVIIHLISKELISDEDQEVIDSKPTRTARVQELIKILKTKGDTAFNAFVEALDETQDFLVETLRRHEQDVRQNAAQGDEDEEIPAERIIDPGTLVTDQDLNKVADGLGNEWKSVALSLGLRKQQIHQCEADNALSEQDKIFDMLHKWKRKRKKEATRHALINSLLQTGKVDPDAYQFMLVN